MPSKPPGRPRVDASDRSVSVHLVLSSRLYDKSYAAAKDARQSVNDWIRERLHEAVRPRSANEK